MGSKCVANELFTHSHICKKTYTVAYGILTYVVVYGKFVWYMYIYVKKIIHAQLEYQTLDNSCVTGQ